MLKFTWTTVLIIVVGSAIGYFLSLAANKKLLQDFKVELEKLKAELKNNI